MIIWNKTNEYYEGTTKNFEFTNKLASFDLDGTLIKTKSGKNFPKDENDWIWFHKCVPEKIKELYKDGYSIVIISNQAGIASGKQSGDEWCKKLEQLIKELNIDMKIYCSINKNKYRKPLTTFIDEFFPKELDKNSFYCGDGAGRNGDFTDTDYKFAINAKLNFRLPENVFLEKINDLPKIKYVDWKTKYSDLHIKCPIDKKNNEMIIMVGYPGSGKSHIAKIIEKNLGYIIINQDTLRSKVKCIKEATNQLKKNNNIIIDATNPSKKIRKEWIELAKDHGYTVRVIKMTSSIELSKHNNIYRSITQNIDAIPDIGYNMYKSKFIMPDVSEGIEEIIEQDPGYPNDDNYYRYLY